MRRILLILLCCFYLFAISGVKLAVHYCHGHFQTITLNANLDEDACCGKKRAMKKHGCCSDKVVEVKIKGEQKNSPSSTIHFDPNVLFIGLLNNFSSELQYSQSAEVIATNAHAPPNVVSVPVYIRNCTFRI